MITVDVTHEKNDFFVVPINIKHEIL